MRQKTHNNNSGDTVATIIYVEHSGQEHSIDVPTGTSLMEAALDNDVPGIDADCGGACACGTCHVKFDTDWIAKLDPRDANEESMLSLAVEVTEMSRLACQISATDEMDGMRVYMPESQY